MYIPHSKEETQRVLKELGLESLEDLFSHIDPLLLSKPDLPEPRSEEELRRYFKDLSKKNIPLISFAGFGS